MCMYVAKYTYHKASYVAGLKTSIPSQFGSKIFEGKWQTDWILLPESM